MTISTLHAMIEALKEGRPLSRVWISRDKRGPAVEKVKELCRQGGIAFHLVPAEALSRRVGSHHQGVCADIAPVEFHDLAEVVKPPRRGLLLILDGVEDTGNLGAIVRTAAAAGVDGIVYSMRHSAPINETVLKTSAGTLGKVRLVPESNLARVLEKIKEAGYWVVGTSPRATQSYLDFDYRPDTALVLGGEHRGLSPLLAKRSDAIVSIPHRPEVESLNVSAAAAILLYEVLRQRRPTSPVSNDS